jgi:hypothetical protein
LGSLYKSSKKKKKLYLKNKKKKKKPMVHYQSVTLPTLIIY